MKDTLIIFDINGTIIERDERTDIPYSKSINTLLKTEDKDAMTGIDTSARSDQDVFMEVLEKHDLIYSDELWDQFLTIYEENLKEYQNSDIWRENAGSVSFIKDLCKNDYPLTLVTGELSIGAKYKLSKLGIWDCFPTGGFGEDGLIRFQIAMEALNKSKEYYQLDFEKLITIGDTVLDIKTARHIGSKIISITTGSNSYEELKEQGPDAIIDNFYSLDIENIFN